LCVYNIFFIHLPTGGPLCCFYILALVNNMAMNVGVHIPFCISVSGLFRKKLRSGIAGSCGSSVFNFLRNLYIVFHSSCTSLHSRHQFVKVPFSPYPCWHLIFIVVLIIAILTNVRWYVIVVLICIFLMISDTHYVFMCMLAICMSSLENWLFMSSSHFLIEFFFFILSCMYFSHSLDINTLSDMLSAHVSKLPFCFVDSLLNCTKAFSLMQSHVYFCFCFSCLRRHSQWNITKTSVEMRIACVFF